MHLLLLWPIAQQATCRSCDFVQPSIPVHQLHLIRTVQAQASDRDPTLAEAGDSPRQSSNGHQLVHRHPSIRSTASAATDRNLPS